MVNYYKFDLNKRIQIFKYIIEIGYEDYILKESFLILVRVKEENGEEDR